ncbi:ABC transporter permease [Gorillibacterium massiliense]|uniref:ABC transporter permease n=1 Tax=Gorillibacterium massiliense TaxID=1280390 RepID=UPI0004AF0164|nr:ABC transporter permease [Gorillibacterium massiliense]
MKIRALGLRIIRQFFHDKRTLALMFVAPLLILTLVAYVFNGDTYRPKLAIVDLPQSLISQLSMQEANVANYTMPDAEAALNKNEVDAIISMNGASPAIKLEGSNPTHNRAVLLLTQKAAQALNPAAAGLPAPVVTYLHGSENITPFDNFGPVLVGFFSFFFVFLIAGISFLRERTGGTLERLLVTPLKRWEIVVGYVIGFGIFTVLQSVIIAWFSTEVLGLLMVGSYWLLLLITILLTMTALTLGILLSSYADNEFQIIQFIPIVIVPQVFFSGLFDMDTMAPWLRWLSEIMPLKFAADALRNIMIRGKDWGDIAVDAYVLLAFSILFMLLNVAALRKHRKI